MKGFINLFFVNHQIIMFCTGKKRALEIITASIYAVLLSVISYFHEPWFDESQAWLIARDSNLFDMIWKVMRYEGHTPLWHLLLFIPAQIGVPFEIGLKIVGIMVATAAAAVFIRYAPFPLPARLLIPFTYFLFYQYGVISRSYSLFMLILWITAAVFPKRNKKPYFFCLLLALLGGVIVYGMLIAFGVAIAWFLEILSEYRIRIPSFYQSIKAIFTDRRIKSLVYLGLVNLFYVAILWPMPDRHTPPLDFHLSIIDVLYRLFIAPLGAMFLPAKPEIYSSKYGGYFALFLIDICLFLIYGLLAYAHKYKIFIYGLLTYLSVSLFMSFVYFSIHHTGIYALLILFILWIASAGEKTFRSVQQDLDDSTIKHRYRKRNILYRKLVQVGFVCILGLQIYWSFAASINDIHLPYSPYRELDSFIKKNGIAERKIFDYYHLSNSKNTYITNNMAVLSYFDHNIFYNHNPIHQNICYARHRRLDNTVLLKILKSSSKPEIIITQKYSLPFYKNLFSLSDYAQVKSLVGFYMWKDILEPDFIFIYIRKDLLPQFADLNIQTY